MNICILVGALTANAVVRGQKNHVLFFTVATKNGNGEGQEVTSYANCVMINPPSEVERLLTSEGKGKVVELQGRINRSKQEVNGQEVWNTEVIVYSKSLHILAEVE